MNTRQNNFELWLSFFTILGITAVYLFVVVQRGSIPAASEFFGHSLGVIGFVLMLVTETAYSLRKRARSAARWGRTANWLRFHIFTGLVGPYLVLLHSSWKFNGLAGVVMLLTVLIVASGFLGRYIYTAIPRTADGIEIEAIEMERSLAQAEAELQRHLAAQPQTAELLNRQLLAESAAQGGGFMLVLGRALADAGYRLQWWQEQRRHNAATRAQLRQIEQLLKRRRALRQQIASLAAARRLIGLWHTIHIPIGITLFTAAFIHVLAAIYYAVL
ncbi:MAG: hypothetical protein OHK0052_25410 [Anaerolineales bacterium]